MVGGTALIKIYISCVNCLSLKKELELELESQKKYIKVVSCRSRKLNMLSEKQISMYFAYRLIHFK